MNGFLSCLSHKRSCWINFACAQHGATSFYFQHWPTFTCNNFPNWATLSRSNLQRHISSADQLCGFDQHCQLADVVSALTYIQTDQVASKPQGPWTTRRCRRSWAHSLPQRSKFTWSFSWVQTKNNGATWKLVTVLSLDRSKVPTWEFRRSLSRNRLCYFTSYLLHRGQTDSTSAV